MSEQQSHRTELGLTSWPWRERSFDLAEWLDVCVSKYFDAWVSGYQGVWVPGCLDLCHSVRLFGCLVVWMPAWVDVWRSGNPGGCGARWPHKWMAEDAAEYRHVRKSSFKTHASEKRLGRSPQIAASVLYKEVDCCCHLTRTQKVKKHSVFIRSLTIKHNRGALCPWNMSTSWSWSQKNKSRTFQLISNPWKMKANLELRDGDFMRVVQIIQEKSRPCFTIKKLGFSPQKISHRHQFPDTDGMSGCQTSLTSLGKSLARGVACVKRFSLSVLRQRWSDVIKI